MTNPPDTLARHDLPACCGITDQLDGRYVAPRRFDAYEVPGFVRRVDAEHGHLVVDCSQVEFLDLTAHRALSVASRRGEITTLDPSVAMLLTVDLIAAATRAPVGAAA